MSDLKQWFKERYVWIRSAANRIIQKGELNEQDYKELVELCLKEANDKLEEKDSYEVDLSFDNVSHKKVRLKSLCNIEGINSLAPKNPLEFGNKNLCIIYGQNGSGKSGYVRILKHVCGARQPGRLLPNVFKSNQSKQKCNVVYELNDVEKSIGWDKDKGKIKDLEVVDIYDTSSGKVYIKEENEVSYEPPLLELFGELVNVADNLSTKIEACIKLKTSKLPEIPPHLENTKLGKWYRNLSHETSSKTIDKFANWSEEQQLKYRELKERLGVVSPSDKANNLLKRKKQLDKFISNTIHHIRRLSNTECEKILELDRQATLKENAAKAAANKIFASAPLDGIGTKEWEQLWEKAREYSDQVAYEEKEFPFTEDESRCVLCHQKLLDEAKSRLQSFEEYVKGELKKEARDKRREYDEALELLGEIDDLNLIEASLDALQIQDKDIVKQVVNLYQVFHGRIAKIPNAKNLDNLEPLPDSWKLLKGARKLSNLFFKKAQKYLNDAKDDKREELSEQVKELETRKWLSEQKKTINEEVKRLQQIRKLEEAKKLTNTHALSRKKGTLAKKLITEAFIERFNNELIKLRAKDIRVELVKSKTYKGQVCHSIDLKNASNQVPEEILSEGETRIATLAAFLADVTGKRNSAPFVFDDPITSLDEDYEEAVVRRLVKLSQDRQVIVFTHRLSMTSLLEETSKDYGLSTNFICIRRESWGTGNPGNPPIYARKPKSVLNALICNRLTASRKVYENDGRQAYDPMAKAICSDVRILLERMIEDVLLSSVVHRFRRALHTVGKIHKLSKITDSDCKFFDDMMTKYSKYEHSQPHSTPVPMPLPDELESDLTNLKNWYDEFVKR